MNLILRFLKPHRKLCAVTIILLIVDVGAVHPHPGGGDAEQRHLRRLV